MYTLTYESTAVNIMTSSEMESLLEEARTHNKSKDITGCLIYYKGKFVQLLEGDIKEVQELYDRIKKDPRHKEVTLFQRIKLSKELSLIGAWLTTLWMRSTPTNMNLNSLKET